MAKRYRTLAEKEKAAATRRHNIATGLKKPPKPRKTKPRK